MNTFYRQNNALLATAVAVPRRHWHQQPTGWVHTLVIVLAGMFLSVQSFAQNELEMASGSVSNTAVQGPVSAIPQAMTLLQNTTGTTFIPYSPPISVSVSYSNQVFTNVAGGGGGSTTSTGPGLTFGTSQNTTAAFASPSNIYSLMNGVGGGTNGQFTSNPNGTAGSNIDVTTNFSTGMFVTAVPLSNTTTGGRYYYGNMTVTFNRPVNDPVLHFVGLGGALSSGQGFSAEFDLLTTGVTITRLSGSPEFNVTTVNGVTSIVNSATALNSTCGSGGACGSAKVTGTGLTSITFRVFLRGDGRGAWTTTGAFPGDRWLLGVSLRSPSTISGTIFDDGNGGTIDGTPTNAGGLLFANLVSGNTVVAVASVPSSGTYAFSGLWEGTYSVVLSTTQGTIGSTPPPASLPANWATTGEGVGATPTTGDGTPNGIVSVTVPGTGTTNDVPNVNFGIEQLPTATSTTLASQVNPGGINGVTIPPASFTGTDPDGTITNIHYTAFPTNVTSMTIGSTVYVASLGGVGVPVGAVVFPNGGVTAVTGTTVRIDPTDGAVTAVIPFRVIDNLGQESTNTATASVPFTGLSVSGTVFDDGNGLTDGQVNGTGTNAGGLFANLVDATGNVVAFQSVPTTGVYSFSGISAGAYSVRLSTTTTAVGSAAPTTSVPTGWTFTGEGTATAGDGTPDGSTLVTLTTINVSGVNFGLDQLPVPTSLTISARPNLTGSSTGFTVPPSSFTGTDPDGTISAIRYTAFPTNTTSLTIGSTVYTSANFPAGGVTATTGTTVLLDPVDGSVTANIPFRLIDNAGKEGTTTGTVGVPFLVTTDFCNSQVLFFNEDFGAGTGFGPPLSTTTVPGYTYTSTDPINDGSYGIVNNPDQGDDFGTANVWLHGPDHTGNPNGRMLLINGSNPNQIAYTQPVSGLVVGRYYSLRTYIANVYNEAVLGTGEIKPNLILRVSDNNNNILASVSTGDIPAPSTLTWLPQSMSFIASTSSVKFELVSNAPSGNGNDFALDDIQFFEVIQPVLSTTAVTSTCPATSASLAGVTASNQPTSTTLTWHSSATATAANRITDVTALRSGTYYAAFTDGTCFTKTSPVVVLIVPCANPDAGLTISSTTSGTVVANVAANDVVNGQPATLGTNGNATVAQVGTYPTGVTLNTTTGSLSVAAGTAPGSYTVTYQLCDKLTPVNCTTTVATFTVSPTLSGTVFNDANGLTDNLINGTGTNAGGLFAILTNAASTSVLASVAVNSSGAYSFTGLTAGTYAVRLSTTSAVVGATPPAASVPAGYTFTGEGTTPAGDGTPDGSTQVTLTSTANVTGVNFGLDQLPTPTTATLAAQANPGGVNGVSIPPASFTGTDPDGTLASIRYTAFPSNVTSMTIGTTLYTALTFPAGGVTAATGTAVTIDPTDGNVTVGIPFRVIDNAGQESTTTATLSVPFTGLVVSGTVFDDANGLTDNLVNGTGTNAGGLFANLVDATGNVVAFQSLPATGVYSFSNVATGVYSVRLSTTTAAVGSPAPAISLPTGWTFTGEGTAAAGDGTPNGSTQVTLTTASVAGVNFGLDQLPTSTSATLTAQANPGGTNGVSIAPASFTGTDPDGTVASIRYTAFPTNVDSFTIGGSVYTSANFPAGGVTAVTGTSVRIDPKDGALTAVIPFRAIDNAGVESANTASVNVPFTYSVIATADAGTVSAGTGGTPVANVAANDLINGQPATLGTNGNATVATVGTYPTGITLNTTTGSVSVAQGTPPGVYSLPYQLCDKLTPATCSTAIISVTVTASSVANPDAGTVSAGTGGTPVANVAANDVVNGQPATLGANGNATVAQVGTYPAGVTLNPATGSVSVAAGTAPGSYTIAYQLCDKLTPATCNTAVVSFTVTPAVTAAPDAGTVSSGTGGTAVANVAANDVVNGQPATLGTNGNATVAQVGTYPTGVTLNPATGSLSVAQGTAPGSYTIAYQLCDKLSTPTCTTTTAVITVTPSVTATPDAGTVSTGTGGMAVANVAANDVVNGQPATLGTNGNATVAQVGTYPTGITLNTTTGSVSVAQGTPPGVYSLPYQLCDKLATPTCSTAIISVTVTASSVANPDAGTVSAGTGGTPVANVAANDVVNGQPATLGANGNATVAQVGTYPAGVTLNPATGSVSVAAGTAPGSYTIAYQLCDKLTPATCSTTIVSFTVTPSSMAMPDAGTVNAGTGGTPVANVAANDMVNGQPATLGANGNATVAQVGTYPPGVTLDPATGSLSVAQGTAPGSYTVAYQLCDKLTPTTCSTAIVSFTVTPSVTALPDAGTVSAGTGGTAVANVTANDVVNGQPATLGANGNATVATVGTYPTGVTLDPATGSLSVAAGTAPGSYTVAYQLCDKLTPATCSTAVVSFTVTPGISGTVFDDGNGLTDNVINGTGTNAGGLFVILANSNNTVVASISVPSTGIYRFDNVAPGAYSVRISTTAGTVGSPPPVVSLPANWTTTGEGTLAAGDGLVDGTTSVTVGSAEVSGTNFGIEQLPTPTTTTLASRPNPGGTNAITVPPSSLTGTDPDGTVVSIHYVSFPTNVTTLFIGSTAYTSANFPAGGVTAASNVPVHIDPVDGANGAVSSVITFRVIDNAGKESLTAGTATLQFNCPDALCVPVKIQKVRVR